MNQEQAFQISMKRISNAGIISLIKCSITIIYYKVHIDFLYP